MAEVISITARTTKVLMAENKIQTKTGFK